MLTKEQKAILADRLEAWELVEFLQIPVEDVIDIFEDNIIEHFEDVSEYIDLRERPDTDDDHPW